MNSFEKMRYRKLGRMIITYGLIVLLGIICAMKLSGYIRKHRYYIPEAEPNAECGIPPYAELEELNPKETIRIGFRNPVHTEGDKLYVYLTNYKESEVSISAILYDEDKNIYAGSGMIKKGYFLPYLRLDKDLLCGKEYYIKVVFYNTKDMTNEGSIWIKIGEIETEE